MSAQRDRPSADVLTRPPGDACEDEARRIARRFVAEHAGLVVPGGPGSSDGPGLAPPLRRALEDHLGCDVAGVRLWSGGRAADAAADARAHAFACGPDVVFGADRFRPETPEGLELLVHELVHVVQQGAAPRRSRGGAEIVERAPIGPQRSEMPSQLYDELCPPGCVRLVLSSWGALGTRYGKVLGLKFALDWDLRFPFLPKLSPHSYVLVDFWMWQWGALLPGTLAGNLKLVDPEVFQALKALREKTRKPPFKAEWGSVGISRTDILDSAQLHVYEIKPASRRDEGAKQLQSYIDSLNASCKDGTKRVWGPGDWAPPAEPMVFGGMWGRRCFLRAWRDPEVAGLILYELSCCVPEDEQQDYQVLVPVKMTQVHPRLEPMRPRLEAALEGYLPVAPSGHDYVVLATPRFFGLFVLLPIKQEQDRLTRVRPTPAMVAWMIGSLAALVPVTQTTLDPAHAVVTSFSAEDLEELAVFLGAVLVGVLVGLAAVAVIGELLLAVEVVEFVSAGGETVELGMAAEETLAETGASEATEALQVPEAPTPADAVEGGWKNGVGTGAGSDMGPTEPIDINRFPPSDPPDMSSPGLMGVVPLLPVTANAGTGTPPKAQPIASDPILVAPAELVIPKRGKVEIGAQVRYDGRDYFVIALAASAPR